MFFICCLSLKFLFVPRLAVLIARAEFAIRTLDGFALADFNAGESVGGIATAPTRHGPAPILALFFFLGLLLQRSDSRPASIELQRHQAQESEYSLAAHDFQPDR
jgi:hypothetical protein